MLAAASGVLQVLIFPEPALYFLSWVALAPLIYAILQCRDQDALLTMVEDGKWYAPATAWQGFLLGYLSGVIWYLGSCYWVFHVMHAYGNLGTFDFGSLVAGVFALSRPVPRTVRTADCPDRLSSQRLQPARAGVRAIRVGGGRTCPRLRHWLSLGPARHHADRQHPALADRHLYGRLWHFVRDCPREHSGGSGLPGSSRPPQDDAGGLALSRSGPALREICAASCAHGRPRRHAGAVEHPDSRRHLDARLPDADSYRTPRD